MRIPIQSLPVQRAEIIAPHSVVDLHQGSLEYLFGVLNGGLIHGANFNDPPAWAPLTYGQLKRL